jgi:hypothetical protein
MADSHEAYQESTEVIMLAKAINFSLDYNYSRLTWIIALLVTEISHRLQGTIKSAFPNNMWANKFKDRTLLSRSKEELARSYMGYLCCIHYFQKANMVGTTRKGITCFMLILPPAQGQKQACCPTCPGPEIHAIIRNVLMASNYK